MLVKKHLLNVRHQSICDIKRIKNMEFDNYQTQSEVLADALAYEAMNYFANTKNMEANDKSNFMLKMPVLSILTDPKTFLPNHDHERDWTHPDNKIRFDIAASASSYAHEIREVEKIYLEDSVLFPIF